MGAIAKRESDSLVSCIMPTANRRGFIGQSVRCFLRQDYAPLELLVIDDGADAIADCLPDDPRVTYIRLGSPASVGTKRNVACAQARGEIIVHWDDDDWYAPSRVRTQVRALDDSGVDLCGTSCLFFYEPATDRAWEYRYVSGPMKWLAGTTLAYRRRVWERTPFLDVQVGEDALFLWSSGTTVCDLADLSLCVAVVHQAKVCPKDTGGTYWHARPAADIRALLGDEIDFYRIASTSPARATGARSPSAGPTG
jgi:glycosyltransferase involved in cell wall biosynthesis